MGFEPSRCLVQPLQDPKVSGVTLYISDFSRSVADRVSKGGSSHYLQAFGAGDFFSDPGAAGLTCARSGPIKIAADLKANKEGEDVFTEVRKEAFMISSFSYCYTLLYDYCYYSSFVDVSAPGQVVALQDFEGQTPLDGNKG